MALFRSYLSLSFFTFIFTSLLAGQTASTNVVSFSYSAGGQLSSAQSVNIYGASGAVTARVSQNVDSSGHAVTSGNDNAGVFSYSLTANTDGAVRILIGASANPGILTALGSRGGTYIGTLLVSAKGCADCISVTMYLQIGGATLVNIIWNGAPAINGIVITDTGASTQTSVLLTTNTQANYTVTSNQGWLSVSQSTGTSGGGPAGAVSIALTAYSTGLPRGANYASLTITVGLTTTLVPVTFNVGTGSGLVLSPSAMSFQYLLGTQTYAPGQAVPLTVSQAGATGTFNARSTVNWLLINGSPSMTGNLNTSVSVSVNAPALGNPLSAGNYTGYVYVTGNSLTSIVTVTLTVTDSNSVMTGLVFDVPSSTAYVAPQNLAINGAGTFIATAVANNGGANWLSVTPSNGFLATSQAVVVSVNPTGLPAAVYAGSIQAYLNNVFVQSFQVTMNLGATLNLLAAPSTLTFSVAGGGSQSQMVVVSGDGSFRATGAGQGISVSPASGTAPALLTVTADASALSMGSTTGSVSIQSSSGSQTIPVNVNVATGTLLQASPAAVGLIPPDNLGGGATLQVKGTTDGSGIYQSFFLTTPDFVTASATTGVTPATITLSLYTSALTPGLNSGEIVIASAAAANSPLHVPVTVLFGAGGTSGLWTSPASLTLVEATAGAPTTDSVWVSGQTGASFNASSNSSWLTVSPASGAIPTSLTVVVNPGALVFGTYEGKITLNSSSGASAVLPVTLIFGGGYTTPVLTVGAPRMNFNYTQGDAAPEAQTVQVTAKNATANFTVSTNSSWITATPASGTTPTNINISVNPAGMVPGTIVGTVVVSSPGSANNPQTIVVALTVSSRVSGTPTLAVNANALQYSYRTGGAAPVSQTVRVTSTGAELPFTVTSTNSSWVSVTPASGTTPATLTVTVDPTNLTAGNNEASITIEASGSKQTVSLVLSVIGAAPPSVTAVYNGASFLAHAIAPGEVIAIGGQDLGPATPVKMGLMGDVLNTTLSDTRVLIGGYLAPVVATSQNNVVAIVPYALAAKTSTYVQVEYRGQRSNAMPVDMAATAPGVFSADRTGAGLGWIVNEDGSANSYDNPAVAGSMITVYATGEGQTTPAGVDGKLLDETTAPPDPVLPVTATIGGVPATVVSASGVLHGVAGLMQAQVTVPPGATSGDLVLTIGGNSSQNGLTVAVR